YIDRWARPPALAPGVTLAFRIITPWSSVFSKAATEESNSIVNIPAPSIGRAIQTGVFLLEGIVSREGWPGQRSMGTQLIGAYDLVNGDRVCIVWWEIKMPEIPIHHGAPKFFAGKKMTDIETAEGLRMMAFGDQPGRRL